MELTEEEKQREFNNRLNRKVRLVNVDDQINIYRLAWGPKHPDEIIPEFLQAWEAAGKPEVKSVAESGFGETLDRLHQQYPDAAVLADEKKARWDRDHLNNHSAIWKDMTYRQRLEFISIYEARRQWGDDRYTILMLIVDPYGHRNAEKESRNESSSGDWNSDSGYLKCHSPIWKEPEPDLLSAADRRAMKDN